MTAESAALHPISQSSRSGGLFLGFGNSLRKEASEWLRGPKTLIIAGVSIASGVLMTLVPFIARASNEPDVEGLLTMDPTANVLIGWTGQTVALIVIISTMALLSGERDRGTLAWTLTNPVSPTSILAAKFIAALVVLSVTAVVIPMVVSAGVATVVYGAPPDLATVGTFGLLYLMQPAFYVALTLALGTKIHSTPGVAGVAFAVMLLPQIVGGIVPILGQVSPTAIGTWAMAVAKGEPASALTLVGWLASMAVLVVGAKIVFDREEV